jgi:hypothetical protein
MAQLDGGSLASGVLTKAAIPIRKLLINLVQAFAHLEQLLAKTHKHLELSVLSSLLVRGEPRAKTHNHLELPVLSSLLVRGEPRAKTHNHLELPVLSSLLVRGEPRAKTHNHLELPVLSSLLVRGEPRALAANTDEHEHQGLVVPTHRRLKIYSFLMTALAAHHMLCSRQRRIQVDIHAHDGLLTGRVVYHVSVHGLGEVVHHFPVSTSSTNI